MMAKIFTIWSVDGGVGKTTMSTNLALKTAEMFPDKKVVLLDLNLFNPDIDLHLGIKMKDLKNMLDNFIQNQISFSDIENSMVTYKKLKNLQILTGLYDINYFDKFTMEHFTVLLECLKRMGYDYIFVDVNSSLNVDATFISLCNADKAIIITEPTYPCIRNVNRYIQTALKKVHINSEKIEIVMNKYNPDIMSKREVKHAFGKEDICYVYFSHKVTECVNKSEPFILLNKDKELKKSIEEVEAFIKRIIE